MTQKHVTLTAIILFLTFMVTACVVPYPPAPSPLPTPTFVPGAEIPFETIARDELSRYDKPEPNLLLITDRDQEEALAKLLFKQEDIDQLKEVDFQANLVIALFRGDYPSSGYEGVIEHIIRRGNKLYVYAQLWKPGPNVPIRPAATSYYHIVKIAWHEPNSQALEAVLQGYPALH